MLVIVASRFDLRARALAERWQAHDPKVLTCRDLSMPGWCLRLDNKTASSTAVIGGRAVAAEHIAGVVTCVPAIAPEDLTHVVAADRTFVAAEMTAFLTAWLSSLDCPVLNRPTPTCLMGPGWHQEQWVLAATRLDIPIVPARRRVDLAAAPPTNGEMAETIAITIVGTAQIGEATSALKERAARLAEAAGAELLKVHFTSADPDGLFSSAELAVDISSPAIADAVLDHLTRRHRC